MAKDLHKLPKVLKDGFKKVHDLDQDLYQSYEVVRKRQIEIIKLSKSKDKPYQEMQNCEQNIQKLLKQGLTDCDAKFKLINNIYDSVDDCIQQLDRDFSKFESDVKLGSSSTDCRLSLLSPKQKKNKRKPKESEVKVQKKKKAKLNVRQKKSESVNIANMLKTKSRKLASRKQKLSLQKQNELQLGERIDAGENGINLGIPASASLVLALTNNPSAVLDMPTDPYEPVYCTCHDVSYGDMIGCDNPDCPIEWFHFVCVGIRENPKGLWYCPRCRPMFQKTAA